MVRVTVELGTSSAFRGWVRVRVLGYGFGVRGRKVKSRDCALASDLVRARARAVRAKCSLAGLTTGSPTNDLFLLRLDGRRASLLNQYISARARLKLGRSPRVPPGRAQREPQGYAGLTTRVHDFLNLE